MIRLHPSTIGLLGLVLSIGWVSGCATTTRVRVDCGGLDPRQGAEYQLSFHPENGESPTYRPLRTSTCCGDPANPHVETFLGAATKVLLWQVVNLRGEQRTASSQAASGRAGGKAVAIAAIPGFEDAEMLEHEAMSVRLPQGKANELDRGPHDYAVNLADNPHVVVIIENHEGDLMFKEMLVRITEQGSSKPLRLARAADGAVYRTAIRRNHTYLLTMNLPGYKPYKETFSVPARKAGKVIRVPLEVVRLQPPDV